MTDIDALIAEATKFRGGILTGDYLDSRLARALQETIGRMQVSDK